MRRQYSFAQRLYTRAHRLIANGWLALQEMGTRRQIEQRTRDGSLQALDIYDLVHVLETRGKTADAARLRQCAFRMLQKEIGSTPPPTSNRAIAVCSAAVLTMELRERLPQAI